MKKVIYIFILTFFLINTVNAFSIDVDKIDIRSKSEELINNLDSSYNIETKDFDNTIIYDEKINKYVKQILKLSFEDKSLSEKKGKIVDYMYMSDTNGFDTLNGVVFIENYLKDIKDKKIVVEYIKDIKTIVFNENDRMVFIYIKDALVDDKKQDIVVTYWLKSNDNNNFKLFFPWITIEDNLNNYFNDLINKENNGDYIGGSYNKMSLGETNAAVNDTQLHNLYIHNKDSVVQITGMNDSGSNTYGSGFFITEGVIVTTWSLFLQFLTESNYIYVNDVYGNTYEILGVVAAQTDYDVVVLKISNCVGKKVVFGNTSSIKTGDALFMINSKSNKQFSINYGTNISVKNGRFENMLLLNESDVGSALFNSNGEVVGFNVSDQIYSDLSYANSTDYLKNLQNILVSNGYSDIKYTILETFKQNYYLNIHEEEVINNVSSKVWNKYKKIGNLEKNIKLDLIKASYVDEVLSLRYKNKIGNMIDSMYLISSYTDALVKDGYVLTYQDNDKIIYANKKNKIVIKNNLHYLIILIMEI